MATVIVLDDEERLRELIKLSLVAEGYETHAVGTAAEAFSLLDSLTANTTCTARDVLLITDIRMPGMHGLEVISKVHQRYPGLPIIVCSSMVNTATVQESFELWDARQDVVAVLDKPFSPNELLAKVNEALRGSGGRPGQPA